MDRKTYMRDIYSKHWGNERENYYVFSKYDEDLFNYISSNIKNNSKILEVAVGTGPFADMFQKSGNIIHGVDISPDLIKSCESLNPNIICKVGDAENLDYPDSMFDCTYCFHSTWYFPNIKKSIEEMLRVTSKGGLIVFDIQNENNEIIINNYKKHKFENKGIGKIVRIIKNLMSPILGRGIPNWQFVIHETPTNPEIIYKILDNKNIDNYVVMKTELDAKNYPKNIIRKNGNFLEKNNPLDKFTDSARLIFAIRK